MPELGIRPDNRPAPGFEPALVNRPREIDPPSRTTEGSPVSTSRRIDRGASGQIDTRAASLSTTLDGLDRFARANSEDRSRAEAVRDALSTFEESLRERLETISNDPDSEDASESGAAQDPASSAVAEAFEGVREAVSRSSDLFERPVADPEDDGADPGAGNLDSISFRVPDLARTPVNFDDEASIVETIDAVRSAIGEAVDKVREIEDRGAVADAQYLSLSSELSAGQSQTSGNLDQDEALSVASDTRQLLAGAQAPLTEGLERQLRGY